MKYKLSAILFFTALLFAGCENTSEPSSDLSIENNSILDSEKSILAKGGSSDNRHKNCGHRNKYDHKRDCQKRDHDRYCEHTKNDYNSKSCKHKNNSQHDRDCKDNKHDRSCDHDDDDEFICDEDGVVLLWAGQTIEAGTVTVTRDNNKLTVTYATSGKWDLSETHLDISLQPYTQRGSPGQYDYKKTHSKGTKRYTYTIPLTWKPETKIYFLAHAVVKKSNSNSTETAFGGTVVKPKNGSWYGTFCYIIPSVTPPTFSISGFAFNDANSNGVRDLGESGLANADVSLSNGAITTSDDDGFYSFLGLTNDTYTVTADGLNGYNQTSPATVVVTIASSNKTAHFGYSAIPSAPTYSISGYAFFDINENGIRDGGDVILSNITITLDGTVVAVTDASGYYSFTNLAPETYSVAAGTLVDFVFTTRPLQNITISNENKTADFGYRPFTVPLIVIDPEKAE